MMEITQEDREELYAMLSDWRAFKQAFWDGFFGRPLQEQKP